MKLVQKLTIALMIGTCVILAANGFFRVRREVAFFEEDRQRDHELIGRSIGAAVSAIWKEEGQGPALDVIRAVNTSSKIQLRWFPQRASDPSRQPHLPRTAFEEIRTGQIATTTAREPRGESKRFTYVPVDVTGQRMGVLELSESLLLEQHFVRSAILDATATAFTLALISVAISALLGFLLVGRPVRLLIEKARRIGRGEFSEPVVLKQRDEFADLAREVNAMADQLRATINQLRHADRLATVGQLASGLAHELGTPLNIISARGTMIATGETDGPETTQYARVILDATERMTKIIRQLLEFARRKRSQKTRCDLDLLARQTLDLLRPLAKKKDVSFQCQGEPLEITIDAGQIQQALTNLVVNGIQAMPRGGALRVQLASERVTSSSSGPAEGFYAVVRVTDEGEGIPPENLERIFEPFFTTKDVGEGTGLGLSVSYGIIQEHGGRIVVESDIGKGSTFSIYLPAPEPT